jgi:hypothetical protein
VLKTIERMSRYCRKSKGCFRLCKYSEFCNFFYDAPRKIKLGVLKKTFNALNVKKKRKVK